MNIAENTNQSHATKITGRTTAVGFRRRTMAGALLVMGLTASAVGLAATSRADDGAPPPGTDITVTAPQLPPLPAPALPWLQGFVDRALHGQLHCGFQRADRYRCDWF